MLDGLKIGTVIDNNELIRIFQCGNMGGMRVSSQYKTLVLITDHTNTLYKDVWKNDTLFYTGQGSTGDQKLTGPNKILYESASNDYKVVLFEVFESGSYVYKGAVFLIGQPYMENQNDINGNQRLVWVFPLHLLKEGTSKGIKNQLRIKKIALENIRNFKKIHEFDFSQAEFINTVSGKNGAGKSTVFECVSICQKAYYIKKYYSSDKNDELSEKYNQILTKDLEHVASNKHSSIVLVLSLCLSDNDDESEAKDELLLTIKVDFSVDSSEWSLTMNPEDDSILQRYWNLYNPTNVIVLLDADKMVDEDDFTFQKINMITENTGEVIDFIMDPKKTYQNLYNIAMNSYIHNRLVPSNTGNRKDKFTVDSKLMFAELMSDHHINMWNFTGQQKKDQFIQLVKRDGKYDMRQMSSGEKLIWYILQLFNYIKSISILIIDEPENHLHEQLSWSLVKYLAEINKEQKNGVAIEQVFMLTHAKNLIYNNFSEGANYLIDNNSLQKIERENCEDILRSCGISYIDDKVIYVEGKTEIALLEKMCSETNIKVRQLSNCEEIIRVFRSLSTVKDLVYVPKYVFLIDKDTRDDSEIEELENNDTSFFNKHFVVLPCHEIENLFLDEAIISEQYNKLMHATDPDFIDDLTPEDIKKIIKKNADIYLINTKKKYLNNKLNGLALGFKSLINQRDININSKQEFDSYIDCLFNGPEFYNRITKLKNTYSYMSEKYDESKWDKDWKALCDGKSVYGVTIKELMKGKQMKPDILDKNIKSSIIKNKDSIFNKWWGNVEALFN